MWYNKNWKYRVKITIDHTKVSGNLTDFPIFLNLANLPITFQVGVNQTDGRDIRITTSEGVECAREVVFYNSVNDTGELHFKAPYLSNTIDTVFYLYYGNASAADYAAADPYGSRAVWSNGYVGVYHFANGTTLSTTDSTGANDATNTGGTATSGTVDGAANFNGSSQFMRSNLPASLLGSNFSISAWASLVDLSVVSTLIAFNSNVDNTGWALISVSATQWEWQQDEAPFSFTISSTPRTNNVMTQYVVTSKGSGVGDTKLYTSGVAQDDRGAVPTISTPTYKLQIAREVVGTPTRYWSGKIDELRFSNVVRAAVWVTTEYNNQNAPTTFYTIAAQELNGGPQKYYIYRVYSLGVYVTTWVTDVINEPAFTSNINSGAGQLVIQLGRDFDDFGEDDDVKLNNKVDCWVVDKEAPNGSLLYSGYISGYKPIIEKAKEYVEVTLFSYASEFSRMMLRDGSGNTTIAYSSYDPSNMLKDIIDKYRAQGGTINYSANSIAITNTTSSYTFNTNTTKEAVDKIIELCPVGWYWYVDPNNTIYLQPNNVQADHTFTLGLEVESLATFRRVEDLVNRVLFTGGGSPPLFLKYENTGSQAQYGLYEKKYVDQRVTSSATASTISNRIIDAQKDPEIRSRYEIVDGNGPGRFGYDIESIRPGQSLKIRNLRTGTRSSSLWDVAFWDTDVWDQTLSSAAADVIQILSIQYKPDSIILDASSRLPQIAKRIEDIDRNLQNTQTVDNPTAPS